MEIKQRLEDINARIQKAAEASHRNAADIRLVTVSKTFPAEVVEEAVQAGVDILGENYIQEAREKIAALARYPVSWHFIGHLQSNKAKYAVKLFDLIHSVDTFKLARELDKQAKKIGKIQDILIQVNISQEETKSGVATEEALQLVTDAGQLSNVAVKGLMTMPPFFNQPEKVRPYFTALRKLRDHIRSLQLPNVGMDELSMGMTGDFEVAIAEGATMVRIGTAIFGERS